MIVKGLFRSQPARTIRSAYSTKHQAGRRNTARRPPHPAPIPKPPDITRNPSQGKTSRVDEVSGALQAASAGENNLLSPVHIPEDPYAIIKENHPATSILSNSAIVVQRQLELMNLMIGFEQANKYVIMDGQGNHIGFMAEKESGMGNAIARQTFRTHRSFTAHVFDKHQKEVLRFHRPFAWINSHIRVYDPLEVSASSYSSSKAVQTIQPGSLTSNIDYSSAQLSHLALSDMRVIGEAQQKWAPLRRKYNLFLYRNIPESAFEEGQNHARIAAGDLPLSNSQQLEVSTGQGESGQFGQFAYVDEPFLSWDFSLKSADSRLIGSVNRNFAGFGREIFTDTGVYALRMDSAGLADEPRHWISRTDRESKDGHDSGPTGMTLDQRAVMLATAVSVDFDYFSRQRSGGMGFMPLWWPYGGGAAEGGAAAGEIGAAEGGEGALGEHTPGFGDDASPTAGQPGPANEGELPLGGSRLGEEVWGEGTNPWGSGSSGGGSQGGGGGVGGGGGGVGDGGGGGFDIGDWL
ncbi:MAG: Phospholipid scramblase 3 [Candelina submexicana]|nr:MAG: Phospholipid scramblase 3 [Candelina submexicana]